ncbi:DHHW family protein [Bacillus sp. N9]
MSKRINDFSNQLEDLGVSVFFALAPTKSIIYEEMLPKYYKGKGKELSNRVIGLLRPNSHPIDLRVALFPHKNEEDLYFYSDHHWKPKAAFYSYQLIINEMRKVIPDIPEPLTLDDFEWVEDKTPFFGSESRRVTKSNTKRNDTITIVIPKFSEEKLAYVQGENVKGTFIIWTF